MIELVISSKPVDEVPARVILATLFEDVRPLKGATGLIDWRLNGRLSEMILQGRISGHYSESLIMPSQGRMASREIFLFGLGRTEELTDKKFEDAFSVLITKLARLKSNELVVSFGDLARDFMGWRAILRHFVNSLCAIPSRGNESSDSQIVCSENAKWVAEAKKRNMDFGPDVKLTFAY